MNYIETIDYTRVKVALSPKRFAHTMRVYHLAMALGRLYGIEEESIFLASLYHDYVKEWRNADLLNYAKLNELPLDFCFLKEPSLLHGPVAAHLCLIKGWIADNSVYDAIFYHTVGDKNLDTLGKIIYIADAVEPGRNYPHALEFRELAFKDLDLALIGVAKHTIKFLENKGMLIHRNTYKMLEAYGMK